MTDLRRDKGGWKKRLTIPEGMWARLIGETIQGVLAILEVVKKGLGIETLGANDIVVLAGLYTFALEEYGKAIRLSGYTPRQGSVTIDYSIFRAHQEKFADAIEALPPECALLGHPGEPSVRRPKRLTEEVVADFDSRQAIFYSDIREDLTDLVAIPEVDQTGLRRATELLEDSAMKFRVPGIPV